MKVLFWIDKFPTFSETFIRDQIIALLDEGIDVLVYTKNGLINESEIDALLGFESYKLKQRIVNIDCHFKSKKLLRFFNVLPILLGALIRGEIEYYLKALNYKKHGKQSQSLRLFFQVHYLIKNKINIIHAHFGPNGNRAVVFKQLKMPIKLFTTFHGYDIRLGIAKGGDIYKDLFSYSNAVISISEYNYQNLLAFGAKKEKIISITNGINVEFFKRKSSIKQTGILRMLSVARLVEEKSLNIAIEAVALLLKKLPDLELEYKIIGEGAKRLDLQNLINSHNLSDKIHLLGAKNSLEVRDLMINSDFFLLSSKSEALPIVLLEAQAAGLIVLATEVGSIKAVVKGGSVVPPQDVNAINQSLIKLLDNRNNWPLISEIGHEYVSQNHDLKKSTKKLLKFYKL